jgi:N-6 DNA Methylase
MPGNKMKMSDNSYHKRIWEFLNRLRASGLSHRDLRPNLKQDFNSGGKFFSKQEYSDPAFREALLDVISSIGHSSRLSSEAARFVKRMVGPGEVLNLYSRLGELLFEFGLGVGIDSFPDSVEWCRFFAKASGSQVDIVEADPLEWTPEHEYQRIVAVPPFGNRQARQIEIFERLVTLTSSVGILALLVPGALLWGTGQQKRIREVLSKQASLAAVVTLSTNAFQGIGIHTALVVMTKSDQPSTFMAMSKSLADLPAIADDYHNWRAGNKPTIGFEAKIEGPEWDITRYEPVDFELGQLPFEYKLVTLRDVATVHPGKQPADAKLAINRTGSKVVWTSDEPKIVVRNNIFLSTGPGVNPSYLHLYLNSAIGRGALKRFIRGTVIPYVRASEIGSLPVVLPSPAAQNQIVQSALEVRNTVTTLESLVVEGRDSLKDKLFDLGPINEKFQRFSERTQAAFHQDLPFPIAVVSRKVRNAANNTQRFSLLIELFEVAIRFVVLVNLADYLSGSKQSSVVAQQLPEMRKLVAPALGDWVTMFKSFARIKSTAGSQPFLKEIKEFSLDKYQRTLQEFVEIRNASLRGHGATLSEEEYGYRYQQHAPKVFDLVGSLSFLSNYTLLKTGSMEKNGDFYKIIATRMMGDNPNFEGFDLTIRSPLDSKKVLLLNRQSESLVLDPFIILERCPECKRHELLLMDKMSDKKATYIAYESGHRPTFDNVDRFPTIVRELATRSTS